MCRMKYMNARNIITALLAILICIPAAGKVKLNRDSIKYDVRIGYNIGGTAPVDMPATIRGLSKYTLQPNAVIAIGAKHHIIGRWGLMSGFRFEYKNMEIDARVKNYFVDIVMGGQSLSGTYTGHNVTKVKQFMITIPLMANYELNDKFSIHFGPYVSYLISKEFSGYVYNGHLRVDRPTGPKVEMGDKNGSHGVFDFSDHMRRLQYGVSAGADWKFHHLWGAFAEINWGLSGLHHSGFKTIDPTLYPIFGSLGVIYQL